MDENNFNDLYKEFYLLYEKYGETIYDKYLSKMIYQDVLNETGKIHLTITIYKSSVYKIKKVLKLVRNVVLTEALFTTYVCSSIIANSHKTIEDNQKNAIYELIEYDNYNKDYATYIDSFGLNDLEVIVKVMYDIWNGMKYYGLPDSNYDKIGIGRLSIYESGTGVCRHIADDMTAKLNAMYIKSFFTNGNIGTLNTIYGTKKQR